MKTRLSKLFALLAAMAMLATACGSDGVASTVTDTASGAADAVEEVVDDAMEDEEVGGGADAEAVDSAVEDAMDEEVDVEATGNTGDNIADLEAQWADARAAVVANIVDNGYGVGDDNILRGPAGFELDLSTCPSDWSDTAGLRDGTIIIGHTTPQSGNLAAYGNIGAGMQGYFEYVNENGGIAGNQIEMLIKDDAYDPTLTQEAVDELLQAEDPFYIHTLGSPNTFSVYNKLNESCVPHPFAQTGHQAWGDPEFHPWTTGLQMSYATESLLWGSWIENNLGDQAPVTVAALVMDNDFGLAYEQGFERFVEESDIISEVTFARHDPASATLTNEMTTLAAAEADVFISMTAGAPCPAAITEASRAGITETAQALFTPSVCKAIASNMTPAEEAAEGWYVIGGGWIDNTDPQYTDDPYISFMNAELAARGLDPGVSLQGAGFGQFAWTHVEAMRIAAELPGGLSRTNLILAIRAMEVDHPGLLDGIAFAANGGADAYLVEGSDISQFDYEQQAWIQQGGVIDLNGQSPNCAWVSGDGC